MAACTRRWLRNIVPALAALQRFSCLSRLLTAVVVRYIRLLRHQSLSKALRSQRLQRAAFDKVSYYQSETSAANA